MIFRSMPLTIVSGYVMIVATVSPVMAQTASANGSNSSVEGQGLLVAAGTFSVVLLLGLLFSRKKGKNK